MEESRDDVLPHDANTDNNHDLTLYNEIPENVTIALSNTPQRIRKTE